MTKKEVRAAIERALGGWKDLYELCLLAQDRVEDEGARNALASAILLLDGDVEAVEDCVLVWALAETGSEYTQSIQTAVQFRNIYRERRRNVGA